ncbi:MAG: DUF2061 domain-containing protein [Azospirillum sp.]|nr:DUF2061 domain-containing protein [Azospirillum sp.]
MVLATHAVEPDPGASWKTALAKTLSWRALATTDTMLISYIMSGDLRVAGSIALAEVVSKMAAYFGHELAWDYFRAHGKDAVNAIELDTAGTNRGSTNEKPRGGVTGLLSGLLPPSWSRSVGSWLPEPPDPTPAAKPTAQPRSRDWLPDSWLPSNWFSSDAGAIKK